MKPFHAHAKLIYAYALVFLFFGVLSPAFAQLSLVKTASLSSASPGDAVTYILSYSNPSASVTCLDSFEGDTAGNFPPGWTNSANTWTVGADNGPTSTGTRAVTGVAVTGAFPNLLNSCAGQVGDGYIQTDVKINAGSAATTQAVLLWRFAGTNSPSVQNGSNYQALLQPGTTNNVVVGYYDFGAGQFTQVQAASFTLAAGTWVKVKFEVTGSGPETFNLSINDTAVITGATTTFNIASGQAGLQANTGSTVEFDNVQIVKYPQVYGATITDTLPTGLTYQAASGVPAITGQRVVWGLGNVAGGVSGFVTVSGLVNNCGVTLSNSAELDTLTYKGSVVSNSVPTTILACTPTATLTSTFSFTPTFTSTPTSTGTSTRTGTPTQSFTPTPTDSTTATPSPSLTATPTSTFTSTETSTVTDSFTPTFTFSFSPTSTFTPTQTGTPTGTDSFTPTFTSTDSTTATPSPSLTASATSTPTVTDVFTSTPTPTETDSFTPTSTSTDSTTATPSPSLTASATSTPTVTDVFTSTPTPTETDSFTPTSTLSFTPTNTSTETESPTATDIFTSTLTSTPTITLTFTASPTSSSTPSMTSTDSTTATPSPSLTASPSATPTSTTTDVFTSTPTVSATATGTPSPEGPLACQKGLLNIFNSGGELVRTLCGDLPNQTPGNLVLGASPFQPNPSGLGGALTILLNGQPLALWNALDQGGNLVPNGYYFLVLNQPLTDGSVVTLKWTVYLGTHSGISGVQFSTRPNLAHSGQTIQFLASFLGGAADSRSHLKLYAVSGEMIRVLGFSSGSVSWDLKNERGQEVSSGLYLAVLDGVDPGTGLSVEKTSRALVLR